MQRAVGPSNPDSQKEGHSCVAEGRSLWLNYRKPSSELDVATTLSEIAPAFVSMAHDVVWATVATASSAGEPRTRVMHPMWEWDDDDEPLRGFVATWPTPVKSGHLTENPRASVTYWSPSQDTCTADCDATLHTDLPTKQMAWEKFASTPEPLGFDPTLLDGWDRPESDRFAVVLLNPYRLRVFPGSLTRGEPGRILTWVRS